MKTKKNTIYQGCGIKYVCCSPRFGEVMFAFCKMRIHMREVSTFGCGLDSSQQESRRSRSRLIGGLEIGWWQLKYVLFFTPKLLEGKMKVILTETQIFQRG